MLPISLKLSAFGPFPGSEEIDFTKFYDQELMLINGPTGAGKTSILDAICYALFGETTGQISKKDGRAAKSMRSQYADLSNESSVQFTFKVASTRYEVFRSIGGKRPKKKGEGFVEDKPKAHLKKFVGSSEEFEILESAKPQNVSKLIVEILGLGADQFRQVAILPQGKFREFLMSDSSDKEKILSALFETHVFNHLIDLVKSVEKQLGDQLSEIEIHKSSLLKAFEVDSFDEIEQKLTALDEKKQKFNSSILEKENDSKKFQKICQTTSDLLKLKSRYETAQSSSEKLLEREEEMSRLKDLADKNFLYADLYNISSQKEALVEDRQNLEKSNMEKQSELEELIITLSEYKGRLEEMGDFSQKSEEFQKKISELKSIESDLVEFKQESKKLADLEKEIQKISNSFELNEKEEKDLSSKLEQLESTYKLNLVEKSDLIARNSDLSNLDYLLDLNKKSQSISARIKSSEENHYKICNEILLIEKSLIDSRREYADLEKNKNDSLAMEIRQSLSDNQECPVCGSMEHPVLSGAGQTNIKGRVEENIDYAFSLEKAGDQVRSYELKSATLEAQKVSLEEQKLTLESELSETNLKYKEISSVLTGELSELKKEKDLNLVKITKLDNQNSIVESEGKMARAAHKKLAELVYGQKEELNSLNIQRATLNTKLNSLRSEHSLEAISVNLNKLSEQFSSYKNEYKNISDKLSNLNRAEATLNAFIKSNGERAALLTEKLKTSENNLKSEEDRLQVTLSDAMKVKIGKDEIADYGTKTKEFFESLGQIKSSLVEIDHQMSAFDEELRNLKVNELNDKLTDVEDSLSKTNHDLSELMEAKGGLVEEISSLISAKEKYEALLSKFEDSEKHYRKISFVSKAVSGNNEMKLNLSRYALAIIFDEILEKATEILYTTSKGRYLLLRSDNHADKRKSFGLDLEVFDEHTGQKRPVNTLSGGESFIASLSLALGLSEVVKATNGGLRLDMLFIDEGFGSLDSDSLARALEALKDVGAVASVVGIITHVSEIKEEIPARIEVIPSVSGSTLSYTLPNVGG